MSETSETRRWLRITLRSAHIVTVAAVFGAALFASEAAAEPWLVGALVSGGGLMATDLVQDKPYFAEVRGVAIMLKLLVLAAALAAPAWRVAALVGVMVLSVVVSHMPGRLRHRRLGGKS